MRRVPARASLRLRRELATLVTTWVEVAEVQVTAVEGYTGGLRVAIVVRGDFLLGIDLDQARLESVDAGGRAGGEPAR